MMKFLITLPLIALIISHNVNAWEESFPEIEAPAFEVPEYGFDLGFGSDQNQKEDYSKYQTLASPKSKEEFCSQREDFNNVKNLANSSYNLMAFQNQGGFARKGVCWWHSRFQRNALYLTFYRPDLPADSDKVVLQKIKQIRKGDQIVQINGFENFYQFTLEYQDEIQKELNKWQRADGIRKFKWVKGLKGKPRLEPAKLKAAMDRLYYQVNSEKKIVYQKLQVVGVTAHAWLVFGVDKTDNGYKLTVIDSNSPQNFMIYDYVNGMTHFYHPVFKDFAPHTENEVEVTRAFSIIKSQCK